MLAWRRMKANLVAAQLVLQYSEALVQLRLRTRFLCDQSCHAEKTASFFYHSFAAVSHSLNTQCIHNLNTYTKKCFLHSVHQWCSGIIVPSHGTDPGSTPGWCNFFAIFVLTEERRNDRVWSVDVVCSSSSTICSGVAWSSGAPSSNKLSFRSCSLPWSCSNISLHLFFPWMCHSYFYLIYSFFFPLTIALFFFSLTLTLSLYSTLIISFLTFFTYYSLLWTFSNVFHLKEILFAGKLRWSKLFSSGMPVSFQWCW